MILDLRLFIRFIGYSTQFFWGVPNLRRVIPSEKVSQNIDPFENCLFVTIYQHWTEKSALQPFLALPDPLGGLGGPIGIEGVAIFSLRLILAAECNVLG